MKTPCCPESGALHAQVWFKAELVVDCEKGTSCPFTSIGENRVGSKAIFEWQYLPANLSGLEQRFDALGATLVIDRGTARAEMDESQFRAAPDIGDTLLLVIKARVAPFEHLAGTSLAFHHPPALTITHDDGRPTEIHAQGHASVRITDHMHFQLVDKNGIVTFDSELDSLNGAQAKAELLTKHATDSLLSRLLVSLGQSRNDPDDEFIHLYEILEALATRFGHNQRICGALGVDLDQVKNFHRVCNSLTTASRHRGLAKAPLVRPDATQYSFARGFAWELIVAYATWLDSPSTPTAGI